MNNRQVEHRQLHVVLDLDELLLIAQVKLVFTGFGQLLIFFFKLLGLFAKFVGLFKEFQESTFTVIALLQLGFELFGLSLVQLIVVVQLIKVIHQFLVTFNGQLCLHLLHVLNFLFVAAQLLFHFLHHFVSRLIALLHV